MSTISVSEVEVALAPMMKSFEADGYQLKVLEVGETLSLKLLAMDDACPDCLVPAKIMTVLISTELKGAYKPEGILIEYPNAGRHPH